MADSNIVYLASDIIRTYMLFKFLNIFLDRTGINIIKEILSYILYYVAVGTVFIIFKKPNITVITNIICLYIISLNYNSSHKKRIFAIVYTYTILMMAEFCTYWGLQLTSLFKNLNQDMQLIYMQLFVTLITIAIALFLTNIKKLKDTGDLAFLHWIATLTIPLITILLTLLPVIWNIDIELPVLLVIIIAMFLVNILVFYLYDELLKFSKNKLETALLQQQSNAYEKQLEIIYQSQESIRIFRHDLKNHLNTLNSLLEENEIASAKSYLNHAFDAITYQQEYCRSGNFAIDSILNFKIYQAVKNNIMVSVSLVIPEVLDIEPFDLSTVLCNLLDNAISASLASDKKFISINIYLDCDVLFIKINNSHKNDIIINSGKFISSNGEGHGLGIVSVERTIKKYSGEIAFEYDEKEFKVKAILFTLTAKNAKNS